MKLCKLDTVWMENSLIMDIGQGLVQRCDATQRVILHELNKEIRHVAGNDLSSNIDWLYDRIVCWLGQLLWVQSIIIDDVI